MTLSVIIPIYNCERFLARAIDSVLAQKEVDEIILVEDFSLDNSIGIAKDYAQKYPEKIILIKNNENLGCAESRNIGIRQAKGDYIAFLDADDYYLVDRFKESLETLEQNKELAGVFGALGVDFLDQEIEKKYYSKYKQDTTIRGKVNPENILGKLIRGQSGWIHLDTLLLRKSIVEKVGYFDKELNQGEDMHFIFKILLSTKLDRISISSPVAKRGVHDQNRITKTTWEYHTKIIPKLFEFGKNNSALKKYKMLFWLRHFYYLKLHMEHKLISKIKAFLRPCL